MTNPFSRFFRRRKPEPPDPKRGGAFLLSATLQVIVARDPEETFSERASVAMTKAVNLLSARIGRSVYVINADGQVEAHEIPEERMKQ